MVCPSCGNYFVPVETMECPICGHDCDLLGDEGPDPMDLAHREQEEKLLNGEGVIEDASGPLQP